MEKLITIIIIVSLAILKITGIQVKTPERITNAGYFVETHIVHTFDGYILTLYRMPYSPKLNNKNEGDKPIIMLVHGLFCSSDTWLLCGPDNGIAYMLVDAGYDVWLINSRGNLYSRNHITLNPLQPKFWEFSAYEIGIYDIPASIDYILKLTEQNGVHYIGHSQGSTVLVILLSEIPSYNKKIKTSYHISPVAFSSNAQSPLYKTFAPLLGQPSELANFLGKSELLPNKLLNNKLASMICQENSNFLPICSNVLFLIGGWNSSHFNYTLLSDAVDTHPAGCSTRQYIHILQEYKSGHFRKYDYGFVLNHFKYGTSEPPDYKLENINLSSPMNLMYSTNDYLSDEKDVIRFANILKGNATLRRVCYKDFNHLDFIWAIDVKEIINDCIVDLVNMYENRSYNKSTFCKCLKEVDID